MANGRECFRKKDAGKAFDKKTFGAMIAAKKKELKVIFKFWDAAGAVVGEGEGQPAIAA